MTGFNGDKERLELALEAGGLDLWENDLVSGQITHKVEKIFRELGYDEDESVRYVDDIFTIVHPDDVPVLKNEVEKHLNGDTEQYRCEFRIRAKNGQWLWYANYGKIMDRDDAHPGRRFIGVTFNIDDRKRRETELELINRKLAEQNSRLEDMNAILQSLASSDPLTGIANRRRLLEMGEHEFKRGRRFDHEISLLILDIDHFKQVNDTWGHMAGDRVICAITDACTTHVRRDIDVVGRIGGEEFAVVLPETGYTSALELAERLRNAVAELSISVEETVISPTVSIGVASSSQSCETFRDLLIQADKALYAAKASGKNCVYGQSAFQPPR
ncbi:MAG: sensor domain-containing diguanylate cyclase [Acidihalobacter sp.]|uniref:sensor domain-containing diguanylate cyclase n=1 Tax=Acidihalobacter sp. TaxID=1872108 RepID=UPI00307DDF85